MRKNKGKAPPRYEAAFREGAVKLVVEGGRHGREVAEELGVHYDIRCQCHVRQGHKPS